MRKKTWIMIAIVLLIPVCTLMFVRRQPVFGVIDEYHGVKFRQVMEPPFLPIWVEEHLTTGYAFEADYAEVKESLSKELLSSGWTLELQKPEQILFCRGGGVESAVLFRVPPGIRGGAYPEGTRCCIEARMTPSWLEREWHGIEVRLGLNAGRREY